MLIQRFYKFAFYLTLLTTFSLFAENSDPHITVVKKGVMHHFARDGMTDHFTQDVFQNWELDTFEIFDQVKDPEGIAIDLGAWIGTTAIWLSNNFSHVVAVEADRVSARSLLRNLAASNCQNVSLCLQPISNRTKKVIFGPRGSALNQSISYIKEESDSAADYAVQSITPKQLLFDFIYTKKELAPHKISFIKCDIEGGEEDILEDVLYFAYHNHVKVYLSFHLDWWKSKNISEFAYLFKYFNTRTDRDSITDPLAYLSQNPFGSLLFEPIENGVLAKKNMPVFIHSYNQYPLIKEMVEQLEKYTTDIVIVDNNSSSKPLLDYYKNDFKYTLLKQNTNQGHKACLLPAIQKLTGDLYITTNPDLKFNPHLPPSFLQDLLQVSNDFKAFKVGLALRDDLTLDQSASIDWESHFWTKPLPYPQNNQCVLYEAPADITFCLVNRAFDHPLLPFGGRYVRIAGDYTCTLIQDKDTSLKK